MRLPYFVVAASLSFASANAEAQNFPAPISPLEAKPGNVCAFGGRVTSLDPGNRTMVVSLGSRFLFHVPVATPIAFRKGASTDFDAIKVGSMVDLVARREAKDWTATKITLPARGLHVANTNPGGTFFGAEFSVRNPAGKVVRGLAAQRYLLFAPPEELVNRGIDLGNHSGSFLLSIRPAGTVASVEALQLLAVRELDERAIRRLSRAKFRPNSVTEARVPVSSFSFKSH